MKSNQVKIVLEELTKTSQILENFIDKEGIPEIEKDIVLSKLRNAYELILFGQTNTEIKEPTKFASEKDDHLSIEQDFLVQEVSLQKEPEYADEFQWEDESLPESEPQQINPGVSFSEPEVKKTELVRETKEEKTSVTEKPIVQSKPVSPAKKEILAEKFQKQSFLNEALAQYQNMMDLSKKLQNQPINDISSAINFNEKFLFIKELFSNNSALYQTTMEKINHAGNFNEAVRYLDEHFSWDFNDPQVQKLLELVRRRYHIQ